MAKNRVLEHGRQVCLPVPVNTVSGQPLILGGALPCVAEIDRNADGEATVQTDGVYELSVEGKNKAGNKAIEVGNIVYMKEGKLSVNNEEGVRFGYALDPVGSGATTKIRVKIGY